MKLYVSGPISGLAPGQARSNFGTAARLLEAIGYDTLDPHEVGACPDLNCGGEPGAGDDGIFLHTWQCYLRYDLIDMLKCDGVALLPGWEESRGARLEYNTAREVGLAAHVIDWWVNKNPDMSAV